MTSIKTLLYLLFEALVLKHVILMFMKCSALWLASVGFMACLLAGVFLVPKLNFSLNSKQKKTNFEVCSQCNILLIDIDILRADELPCYGYFRNTTPNICFLAQKSLLFKDNYAQATWTLPSAFSTVTSLYPTFHRVRASLIDRLDPNIPTLAETFKKSGYQTAVIGGVNNYAFLIPENGGSRGYDLISNQPIEEVIKKLSESKQPWFIHYYISDLHLPYLLPPDVKPLVDMPAPKKLPITKSAYDQLLNIYLKNHAYEVFQPKAFKEFGNIILGAPIPQDESLAKLFYTLSDPTIMTEYIIDSWRQNFSLYMEFFDPLNPADVAYVRMLYDTKLNIIDQNLGRLFKFLANNNLADRTVTVIMSDHGESFGEHETFGHAPSFHTELLKTPLIINAPNLGSTQIETTTSNLDIFPTLMDLVGLASPAGLQGQSIMKFTSQDSIIRPRFAMSEIGFLGQVIVNSKWLYFKSDEATSSDKGVLYDKVNDPQELTNVVEFFPEVAEQLFQKIMLLVSYDQLIQNIPRTPDQENFTKISPEKILRMRTEGYF